MKTILFVAVIAVAVLAVLVMMIPKSKRRFWWEIIRQMPYLIPIYFV